MGFPTLGWEAGLVRNNGCGGFSILERCMGEKEEKKVINEPSYCIATCGLPQKARENFFLKKVGPKLGISK